MCQYIFAPQLVTPTLRILKIGLRAQAVAILAFVSILPALAIGQVSTAEGSPKQKDFLGNLDRNFKELVAHGIVTTAAANEINGEFRQFAERNPKIYEQPGFEYAIPRIRLVSEPPPEPMQAQSRTITEIIGMQRVSEDDIAEIFRRMFAAKKADGIYFEMFVREFYNVEVGNGRFRKPDGTIDKEAVTESMERNDGAYSVLARELNEMRQDGRRKRVVDTINHLIAYAERNSLTFKPAQVRSGLVSIESCVGAQSKTSAHYYAESCGHLITWIGERSQRASVEVQFFNLKTGEAGEKQMMAPWDAKYARDVYGPVFTDAQTTANDDFWRDYFKLYIGTAKAQEATLNARDSGDLLKLEIAVGRTMKLILGYTQEIPFEGKKVGIRDIQFALNNAKRLKADIEASASPTTKTWEGYRDTMKGYDQVLARAKIVGIR